ncbi:MAG: PEP-CTERM system TPR-repeat protein PrsT [Gammaproteobacteria bacterium]|nr:PEP-CTERM system TPR-repeat protein PrsT [Gammaproteobacteria bacterium]
MIFWKLMICLLAALVVTACSAEKTDQHYYDRAVELVEQGEMRAAVIELKNALSKNPNNPQARWFLGKIHLEDGRAAEAEKELLRARELGVVDDTVLPFLARAMLAQGKTAELLKMDPGKLSARPLAQLLSVQAAALISGQKLDEATDKVNWALAVQPDAVEAITEKARIVLARGDADNSRSILEALLQQQGDYAPSWSLLGDLERSQGRLEEAESAYGKAIERWRNNTADYLKRAVVRVDLKKYNQAQEDIDLIKLRLPKYFEVHYLQGLVHFHQQRYPEAKEAFEFSVAQNKDFLPAQFYLGATLLELGNINQADIYLSGFHRDNPNSVAGRMLLAQIRHTEGRFDEVVKLVQPVVSSDIADINAINLLANAYIQLAQVKQAIGLYRKALSLQPESAGAHLRLAAALLLDGDTATAVEQLNGALALDPTDQSAYGLLVQHYAKQKEWETAEKISADNLERNPEAAKAHSIAGELHLAAGRIEAAKAEFAKVAELSDGDVFANQNLAAIAIAAGDAESAEQKYEVVLAKQPDHLDTLMKLAFLYEKQGREADMISRLNQAVKTNPNAVEPRTALARYHLSKGQPQQVAVVLGELLQTQSDNPSILDVLGRSKLALGEGANARSTLMGLVRAQPRSAEAHFLLSQAHALLGDERAMRVALKRAVELDANHFKARLQLGQAALTDRDLPLAETHLKVLKAVASDNPAVMRLEAALAQASGDSDKALALYQQVFGSTSETLDMLSVARQKWVMGESDASLAMQAEWLTAHPGDLTARLALASAYYSAGRLDDAATQYDEVLKQSRDNPLALNNLAWQIRDQDSERALEYAERASRLAPDSIDISDTLSVLLIKRGDYDRAARISDRILSRAPEKALFLYHRAMIDAAAGNRQAALKILKDLLQGEAGFTERADAEALLLKLQTGS